jgi:type III pantothenate kinase
LGVAIDYPKPSTIGADRLANAAAAIAFYGKPSVIVDFGTAVTFDIINASGAYVGGVIAPGLEALTDYLHLRTALLPRVRIAEPPAAIGRSTKHAMLSGCVHGYRGLVRGILTEIRAELRARRLVVAATGGYGEMIAAGIREITHVHPHLTLEGLRLIGNLNPLTST